MTARQAPVRSCHVMLEFPVLSQTFVTDEIRALREAGAAVLTVSLEGGPGADVPLSHHRARSWWTIRRAAAVLIRRPGAVAALFRGPLTVGLRWKLLAAAEEARRFGATAVHAHFAYRSADGAEVIGRALGTGHSVTVHARDIFVPSGDVARRLHAARTVVTVCDYNRDWLLSQHGQGLASKVVVIPCATEVTGPSPAPRQRRAGPLPTIVAVGRLVPKKGIDLLLDACARLQSPFLLVVVGDGPEAPALRARATRLGLDAVVRFAGALGHNQIRAELDAADVFCVPFRVAPDGDRDSMPVVVKEAMAAGLPVVSTAVAGVPEMVIDGETGCLVPPEDPEALAAALDEFLIDPSQRRIMGRRGRELVEERFDLRDQAQRLLEVLA
jgi:colanic acid/amylovoran biosynthesis glycosyltransferase